VASPALGSTETGIHSGFPYDFHNSQWLELSVDERMRRRSFAKTLAYPGTGEIRFVLACTNFVAHACEPPALD
jgi:hypothetical protein